VFLFFGNFLEKIDRLALPYLEDND